MQVYIEYVIIDNLIIDYILLSLSLKASNVKANVFRLILSSIVGTIIAVIIPLINIKESHLFLIKIVLGFLLVYVAGKYYTKTKYFLTFAFFMLFTFLFGGMIIAIFYFADIDYTVYFSVHYNSFMPIGITILLVYIMSEILKKLIYKVMKIRIITPYIRTCILVLGSKRLKTTGFYDSGNRLFDKRTGLPIIVGSKKLFEKIDTLGVFTKVYDYVEIKTVNGNSKINIYKVDKLLIYNGMKVNIYDNVLIGRSNDNFYDDIRYDLLLNSSLE